MEFTETCSQIYVESVYWLGQVQGNYLQDIQTRSGVKKKEFITEHPRTALLGATTFEKSPGPATQNKNMIYCKQWPEYAMSQFSVKQNAT